MSQAPGGSVLQFAALGADPYSFGAGQREVLQNIADGAPLEHVLHAIVHLIEAQAAGMLCCVLLLDAREQRFSDSIGPSLPAEYLQALAGASIGAEAGSCGTAAYRGESVVVEDISTHPYWAAYKHLALPHGLAACWSSPIFDPQREVLGTFAMYYRESRGPTDKERHWVRVATQLASIALTAHRQEQTRRGLVVALEQQVKELTHLHQARVDAETALRCTEQQLRAVIEHTPNVAIQWFDEAGRVLYCNQASERMFGWAPRAAYGKTLDELGFSATGTASFQSALANIARTGEPVGPVEFEFTRADGSQGTLLSTVFALPLAGGGTGFCCTDVDLTEHRRAEARRRQLEQELHRSQRLRALGTLAGGIAHDFNNIIAAIAGHAELSLQELDDGHSPGESLREIHAASQRARDLVRQILTYSQNQEPRRALIELHPLIREACRLLRGSLPSSVSLELDLAAEGAMILADSTQVHQVVMNLVTNAIHALGTRPGTIRIASHGVIVEDEGVEDLELEDGCYFRVSVSDNGCGMDAATLARIFEPFFTTKSAGRGTGLGLSVVHGIMGAHGGAVRVTSELGRGTTFHLYFPANQQPGTTSLLAPSSLTSTKGERVLYVDDEEALVFLATRVLKRLGYRVTGYASAAQALDDFRQRPGHFDVVVSDIAMPGMSGMELARELLSARRELPVVLTSGYVQAEDVAQARSLGVRALVAKPNTVDEFGRLLLDALASSR
jgi:PAS domain S-box-containing protein